MLRLGLVLISFALLGGCNMLMTKDPIFSAADAAGAKPMRLGVWASDQSSDCKYDESQPLDAWPSCASGFVVLSGDTMGGYNTRTGGKAPAWATTRYLLASGDPQVFQIHLSGDTGQELMPDVYVYAGFLPTRFDDQGRVIAAMSWAVQCGPPPPQDAKAADGTPQMGTLHPLPGLKMDESGTNCTTTSPGAARGAARASRAYTIAKDLTGSHWVREGKK